MIFILTFLRGVTQIGIDIYYSINMICAYSSNNILLLISLIISKDKLEQSKIMIYWLCIQAYPLCFLCSGTNSDLVISIFFTHNFISISFGEIQSLFLLWKHTVNFAFLCFIYLLLSFLGYAHTKHTNTYSIISK